VALLTAVRQLIRTERSGGSVSGQYSRRPAVPVRVAGREARQRDLHQARPERGAALSPPGHRRADVPARRGPARL